MMVMMMMIMMMKNMQNKQYKIQFFSLPNDRLRSLSPSSNHRTRRNSRNWCIRTPQPAPIYRLSMTSLVWNISPGQLGCLSDYAPSQLLHTCSLTKHGRLKNVLDFLTTTKNISVLSTFSY